jgi:hypothetical protein
MNFVCASAANSSHHDFMARAGTQKSIVNKIGLRLAFCVGIVNLAGGCDQTQDSSIGKKNESTSTAADSKDVREANDLNLAGGSADQGQASQAETIGIVESCDGQMCGTPCDPCSGATGPCEAATYGYCDANNECKLIDVEVLECPNWNACEVGDVEVSADGCTSCECELVDGRPQVVCSPLECEVECETNADCSENEYCARPLATCGDGPLTSICVRLPTECSNEGSEICGCDGQWWPSPCAAASEGVSVSNFGGCADSGSTFTCGSESCLSTSICKVEETGDDHGPADGAYETRCRRPPSACDGKPSCDCISLSGNQRCEEIGGHVFVIDLYVF